MPGLPKTRLLALTLLAIPCTAGATEEGAQISPLKIETHDVDLYAVSAGLRDGKASGVELAWIPASVTAQCMGKTLRECDDLDHNRRVIEYTDPDGTKRIGFADIPPETPNRVLAEWVTTETPYNKSNPTLLPQLAAMPAISAFLATFPKEGANEKMLEPLQSANIVHATITWTLWPNGEGFRIDKINP